MVDTISADGSLTYCDTIDLPPLVEASIVKTVKDAQADTSRSWKNRFTNPHRCAVAGIGKHVTRWVDGIPGKFACRRCYIQKRACVLFDFEAQRLAIRPVPLEMRLQGAAPGSNDYYITLNPTFVFKKGEGGPWAKEPTRKGDLASEKEATQKRKRDLEVDDGADT